MLFNNVLIIICFRCTYIHDSATSRYGCTCYWIMSYWKWFRSHAYVRNVTNKSINPSYRHRKTRTMLHRNLRKKKQILFAQERTFTLYFCKLHHHINRSTFGICLKQKRFEFVYFSLKNFTKKKILWKRRTRVPLYRPKTKNNLVTMIIASKTFILVSIFTNEE